MDYKYIRKVYAHVLNYDSCITKNESLYVRKRHIIVYNNTTHNTKNSQKD